MDISGVAEREIDNRGLAHFLRSLDEKSRAILGYLWWRRHAEISELRNITDTLDDFEVLQRLKEVINKNSQDLWGKPIVSFEQSKIDPLTGEKILFSWWYLDPENVLLSGGSTLLDIFNEKDNVILIAQLPASVNLATPEIQFKNGILKIKFAKKNFDPNNQNNS